jgi:hypothetical protein
MNLFRASLVVNHLNLNYKFDLNRTRILDGARVGNETRYINHGSGGRDNCAATSKLVYLLIVETSQKDHCVNRLNSER